MESTENHAIKVVCVCVCVCITLVTLRFFFTVGIKFGRGVLFQFLCCTQTDDGWLK